MNDLVSVIVPVFNAEDKIQRCLDSICMQSYQNIEMIVINDGSTDSTIEKCQKYVTDNRFHFVTIENNGVSNARNMGIDLAKGKYIVFVDADDYIEKDMISALYCHVDKYDFIICGKKIGMNEKIMDEPIPLEKEVYTKQDFVTLYEAKVVNPPYCKIYKTDIIKNNHIKFEKEITIGEDLLFNLMYIKQIEKEIRIVNQNLYYYEKSYSDTSLSEKYVENMLSMKYKVYQAMMDLEIKDSAQKENLEKHALSLLLSSITNEFRNKKVTMMKRYQNGFQKLKQDCIQKELIKHKELGIINKIEYRILSSHVYILYFIIKKVMKK